MRRVYYARAVEGRDRGALITEAIKIHDLLKLYDISLVDPVAIGGDGYRTPEEVVQTDLDLLRTCDAVLMDMSIPAWTYVGCICELVYARLWKIPSVIFVASPEIAE